MTNYVGFARRSGPKTLCTFEVEDFPGLRSVNLELFAVRDDHVYLAVYGPSVKGAQPLSIVELVHRPGASRRAPGR